MKSLDNLIDWLEEHPLNRFAIYNQETDQVIEKLISAAEAKQKYGSVPGVFEHLKNQGVNVVQIEPRRKSGNSSTKELCARNFALTGAQDNVAVRSRMPQAAATPQHYNPTPNIAALGSHSGVGLGYGDLYQEEKSKAQTFEQKYEALRSENESLKLKNALLENEKQNNNKKTEPSLLDDPKKLMELVGPFVQMMRPAPPAGLQAAPQPQRPQLSDIKEKVIDIIANNRQVLDSHAMAVEYLLFEVLKDNKPFFDDYLNLLEKHELIKE